MEGQNQEVAMARYGQDLQDGSAPRKVSHPVHPVILSKTDLQECTTPWFHHRDFSRAEVHKWADLRPVTGLNLVQLVIPQGLPHPKLQRISTVEILIL